MDGVSPVSPDRDRILAYEETALTTWPALEQVLLDGWLVRFAGGLTGRANSVNPIYAGAAGGPEVGEKIARCEALYAERGLDCVFRLTPLADPTLDAELAARGYERHNPSVALVLDLDGPEPEAATAGTGGIVLMARPEAVWVDAFTATGSRAPDKRPILEAMLARIPGRSVYGMIADRRGSGIAVAQGALDGDRVHLINVATAPAARRRGLARRLVAEVMARSRGLGAREALIHVSAANEAGFALYRGLGAREVYRYHYRRLTGAAGPPQARGARAVLESVP